MKKLFLLFFFCFQLSMAFAQLYQANGPTGGNVTAYAFTGDKTFIGTGNGVYISVNKGDSWHKVLEENAGITSVVYHQGMLYAGSKTGLYYSSSEGREWTFTKISGGMEANCLAVNSKGVYVGTNYVAMVFTPDLGKTWDTLSLTTGATYSYTQSLTWSGSRLIAGMYWAGFFYSDDDGKTWFSANTGVNNLATNVVYADGENVYGGMGNNMFYISRNRGTSFVPEKKGLPDWFQVNGITSIDTTIFLSTTEGLYYSSVKTISWIKHSEGISGGRIAGNNGDIYFSSGGVLLSKDKGKSWQAKNNGLLNIQINNFGNYKHRLWSSSNTYNAPVYYSDDKINFRNIAPPGLTSFTDFEVYGDTLLAATSSLQYSTDAGKTWAVLPTQGLNGYLECIEAQGNDIYLGMHKGSGVLVSSDRGKSWTNQNEGIGGNTVYDIQISNDYVYASTSVGVFYKKLTESKWLSLNNNISRNLDFTRISIFNKKIFGACAEGIHVTNLNDSSWTLVPNLKNLNYLTQNSTFIFAAGNNKIYASSDGNTWGPLDLNKKSFDISALSATDSTLFIGTLYSSVWLFDLNAVNLIKGKIFVDKNTNGIYDSGETGLQNIPGILENAGSYFVSDAAGDFIVYAGKGKNTLVVENLPKYYSIRDAVREVNFTGVGLTDSSARFAIEASPDVVDCTVDLTNLTPARPGFPVKYLVTCKNTGTKSSSGTVIVQYDPDLTFESGSEVPSTVINNNVAFPLPLLVPGGSRQFTLTFTLDRTTSINTLLTSTAQVNLEDKDVHPQDNQLVFEQTVRGSYDPNEKMVNRNSITKEEVTSGISLTYTVYFQNTGNDTAQFVYIRDTLQNYFQLNSLNVVSASHPYTYSLGKHREIIFRFDNIQLPDSNVNVAGSNGYIKYTITVDPAGREIDLLTNKADIYFDYNLPVTTNTTQTTVEEVITGITAEKNSQTFIYPNPNKGIFHLMGVKDAAMLHFEVMDLSGKVVMENAKGNLSDTFDLTNLEPGIYLLKLMTATTTRVVKFSIE